MTLATDSTQLPSPRRQHRAVDAFLAKHGLESTALAAVAASIRSLYDPELLCRVEHAPRALRLRLHRSAAGAESPLSAVDLKQVLSGRGRDGIG
jgi:hypothetical protein